MGTAYTNLQPDVEHGLIVMGFLKSIAATTGAKTITFIAAGLLTLSGCSEPTVPPPDLTGKACPHVFGVWPTWTKAPGPSPEQLNMMTHLAIAFALPTQDGGLETSSVDAVLETIKPRLANRTVGLILSIGGAVGYGDAFIQISKDEALRAKFLQNIVTYVADNGFVGVDIDWEYWSKQAVQGQGGNDPVESQLLVQLLQDLRAVLPDDIMLSADIFAGSYYGPQYLPEMQDDLDFVNLMAFDFTGGWAASNVSHHSDFPTFRLALKDVEDRGFLAENLVVGIPSYGVMFEDGKTDNVKKVPNIDIYAAHSQTAEDALKRGRVGHTYFETPRNTEAKIAYALSQGVKGFFLFDLTQDATHPDWNILAAIDRSVKATSCSVLESE